MTSASGGEDGYSRWGHSLMCYVLQSLDSTGESPGFGRQCSRFYRVRRSMATGGPGRRLIVLAAADSGPDVMFLGSRGLGGIG